MTGSDRDGSINQPEWRRDVSDPRDPRADEWGQMDALEKIDWMIETKGWALEAVSARPEVDPPTPSYAYSIGVPAAVGFTEIAVFGLAPAAANGLLQLVVDACRGGTEIPLGVELLGVLDNELRCLFAPIDLEEHGDWFATAVRLVPGRAVRDDAAPVPRPQRVHAVRGGLRAAHALRPAGHWHGLTV